MAWVQGDMVDQAEAGFNKVNKPIFLLMLFNPNPFN
ncbi:hypothetical protein CCACVL1_18954 [Corchorus capsularis]|uniref:Uncharacterized protein n=1 Tax=Corchorus capsularis TaxID=210143 RepID=A0A1R3HJ77_COCAP|nr:hypothetical protein CCACVL1_18954 [Corchorus capsularis]